MMKAFPFWRREGFCFVMCFTAPKNSFLFCNIGKKSVFMRLFSMLQKYFLFCNFGDTITARQFIIIINSSKIHFYSVKRKNNRILLCIILLKYNIIANVTK